MATTSINPDAKFLFRLFKQEEKKWCFEQIMKACMHRCYAPFMFIGSVGLGPTAYFSQRTLKGLDGFSVLVIAQSDHYIRFRADCPGKCRVKKNICFIFLHFILGELVFFQIILVYNLQPSDQWPS